tara:strand:+ start:604 stop:942 length:339 start_codon:yes stop_codon:yes gene_type:complete
LFSKPKCWSGALGDQSIENNPPVIRECCTYGTRSPILGRFLQSTYWVIVVVENLVEVGAGGESTGVPKVVNSLKYASQVCSMNNKEFTYSIIFFQGNNPDNSVDSRKYTQSG